MFLLVDIPHYLRMKLKRNVEDLLEMGHIVFSKSPFASLVALIKKKDDSFRVCIDYCELNKRTIEN